LDSSKHLISLDQQYVAKRDGMIYESDNGLPQPKFSTSYKSLNDKGRYCGQIAVSKENGSDTGRTKGSMVQVPPSP